MKLREVVEEIAEKAPNFLSPVSIVRKVTQVRDQLLRQLGSAQQQTETVCTGIDIRKGQTQYILPCPPGNIVDVNLFYKNDWRRIPYRQFNQTSNKPYYYLQAGIIGIVSDDIDQDIPEGIKIFHLPTLPELRVTDMESMTGFDPDFDMLLVYGVLRDITNGKEHQEYDYKYQQLLTGFQNTTNGFETYAVKERW